MIELVIGFFLGALVSLILLVLYATAGLKELVEEEDECEDCGKRLDTP